MQFVGIIEEETKILNEIVAGILDSEAFGLLFSCPSLEEYKRRPPVKKNKVSLIFLSSRENNFELFWKIHYLKNINAGAGIVLVMPMTVDEYQLDKLSKSGVVDVLVKPLASGAMKKCLEQLLHNKRFQSASGQRGQHTNGNTLMRTTVLTIRELEIAELVVKGYTNKKIGEAMFISTHTVNAHLRNIYAKLSINSRTELINKVIRSMV